MKPSVQKIITKLAKEQEKVEAKLEKVELGAVQDFEKAAEGFKKGKDRTENAISEVLKLVRDVMDIKDRIAQSYRKAEQLSNGAEESIKRIEKLAEKVAFQAKELGIDPKKLIDVSVVSDVSSVEGSIENLKLNEGIIKNIINI